MSMNESDTCSQTVPVGLSTSCPAILGPWTLTHMLISGRQLNVINLLWNFRFLLSCEHLLAFAYTEDFFLFVFIKLTFAINISYFFSYLLYVYLIWSQIIYSVWKILQGQKLLWRDLFWWCFPSPLLLLLCCAIKNIFGKQKKNPFSGYYRLTSA